MADEPVVSANSGGLAYEWTTAVAPTARVNSIWGNGLRPRMAIYDTTGVLSIRCTDRCVHPPRCAGKSICGAERYRTTVFWLTTVQRWAVEGRVFMRAVSMRKACATTAEGVLAMQCNGNQTLPACYPCGKQHAIVTMIAPIGTMMPLRVFRVGRITSTGTNLWSDTTRFTTTAFAPNDLVSYSLRLDGDGGAACFWFNAHQHRHLRRALDRNGRMGDFIGGGGVGAQYVEPVP